jgi:hypothetical protein
MNGSIAHSGVFNRTLGKFGGTLPDIVSRFPFSPYDENDVSRRDMGIITNGSSSYMITATPIQSDDFQGPIPAIIVIGRKFSQDFVNELALRVNPGLYENAFNP